MEVNRGYRQTEVGLIPQDWGITNLSSVASKITVGFVGSMAHLFTKSGIPLLRGQNVLENKLDLDNILFISPATHKLWGKSALLSGDVVMVRVGYPGTSCVIPPGLGEANAASLVVVRPNKHQLSSHFLSFVANSDFGKRQIAGYLVGGAQQVLNTKTAAVFMLPLPRKIEQEAIAEALSDADAYIESLEKLIAKKRLIKQGTMQELLTGKRRLPEFNGDWNRVSFNQLFDIRGGLSASRAQLSQEGYCYLHYGDIHNSQKSYIDVDVEFEIIPKLNVQLNRVSQDHMLNDGDVVFVDASEDDEGTSKHVVIRNGSNTPFIAGLHTIIAKPKDTNLDPLFLRQCFQSQDIKSQFKFYCVGTKVSGISKTNIAKISILIPELAEQEFIGRILSDMDSEISNLKVQLGKAQQIKQGMMQELLTGRIRLV